MGYSRETRDFFENKINSALDEQKRAILKVVDDSKVEEKCAVEFSAMTGFKKDLFVFDQILEEKRKEENVWQIEYDKLQEEEKVLREKHNKKIEAIQEKGKTVKETFATALDVLIENELIGSYDNVRNAYSNCGLIETEQAVRIVNKAFSKEVTKELYPEAVAEAQKIDELKDNVRGAVLLSTSQQTLVEKLSRVLAKFGGDIGILKTLIDLE